MKNKKNIKSVISIKGQLFENDFTKKKNEPTINLFIFQTYP